MEGDYLQLCGLINAMKAYNKEDRDRGCTRFRQLLLDMFDNEGPEHLIGVFRMYTKTHQLEEEQYVGESDITFSGF